MSDRGRPRQIKNDNIAFIDSLLEIGTNEQIAARLNVSPRTVTSYFAGSLPSTEVLMANPEQMRALLKDADRKKAAPDRVL